MEAAGFMLSHGSWSVLLDDMVDDLTHAVETCGTELRRQLACLCVTEHLHPSAARVKRRNFFLADGKWRPINLALIVFQCQQQNVCMLWNDS